ncbi:MAG: glycosyltransferase family 4 protein [Gammaproteobacteria bacterium]
MRILYVCHNYPDPHPGDGERFAHDLLGAVRQEEGVETLFLGAADQLYRARKLGTSLQTIGDTADEMMLWTQGFDALNLSQPRFDGVLSNLQRLVRIFHPDVVHFHHVLLLGVEAIQVVRRAAPDARIVLTLQDYHPICHSGGEMIRAGSRTLCRAASPLACHACFPALAPESFVARERHIKNFLQLADTFVAPSRFLCQRYVEWGLPEDRVVVIPNAPTSMNGTAAARPPRATQTVFGCFGNLRASKGTLVALEAARLLRERGREDFALVVHGAVIPDDEFPAAFDEALRGASPRASHHGRYGRADAPALLEAVDWVIVPSIWWESSPLVIQEAFAARRPVICSNIGGMAEAVRDGVDGLWFEAGHAADLAATMERAMDDPELRGHCQAGITAPVPLEEIAARHLRLYRGAVDESRIDTPGRD